MSNEGTEDQRCNMIFLKNLCKLSYERKCLKSKEAGKLLEMARR